MVDLVKLEKLAKAATPGPWIVMDGIHSLWIDAPEKKQHVADVFRHIKNQPTGFPNAAYIAAMHPDKAIELLDKINAQADKIDAQADEITALRAKVKSQAEAWDDLLKASTDNNGVEQQAFEDWAQDNNYDMHQHPLHWLFLNPKTDAARQGWKGAMGHVKEQIKARRAAQEASDE